MPDADDPAEAKSIAPSTSRALVTQSSSLVRRGLALAEALLSRQDAEVYYKSGSEKVRQQDYRHAVEDFTRAIEIDPAFAEAYSSRAFCFGHLREHQKALQDRETVIRLRPHDDSAYVLRAGLHKLLRNYEEALRDYTRAIELAPEKAHRYEWRGALLNELEKYQEAIDDYTHAIELELPRINTVAYRGRGLARHNLGHLEEAISDYTHAMENELWLIEPSYFRGLAYEALGRYQDARQDYDRVIDLSREDSEGDNYIASTYFRRGVVHQKLNMQAEAFADFRQATRLGNTAARAYLQNKR